MNKNLNKRICLEKKWSNICVKQGIPLPTKNGRVLSLSPSAYYYHTGVNADGYDKSLYQDLSESLHDGERGDIEKEVIDLIQVNLCMFGKYFFELKDELINKDYDTFNKILGHSIKKDKYNRVQRLLRKWEQISHKHHYKVKGALRRLNDKCDM